MNNLSRTARGWTLLAAAVLGGASARAADKLQYNRDILPILSENCFACHGPDKAARKAGLRLDVRESALKAEVIVPGKPDKSPLVERIGSTEPTKLMPPGKTQKTLSASQKKTLERWIAEGAEYQPHWAFIAPKRSELPVVKNTKWVRNPIDRFVLAEMEKHGLEPAPEADRRTLARRLSLDLTGLPPTPEEVETFVNDKAADAYERYVDRLMEMPQWGEHRGRYWLDVARYGDTHGIHIDNYREIWPYRDWVIKAFNKNMPFDQFTIEQLAGDLLPNRTLDQQVATGFCRCNITTSEGGAIAEEYLVLYARDRTETLGQTWLGLTAGCAVCHDHKFDPTKQKDFYSLSAFFNNTTQNAMDGNIKDTPPVVLVPRPEDRERWEKISKELADLRTQSDARKTTARAEFDKWLKEVKPEQVAALVPADGLHLHAALTEGKGKAVQVAVDGKPRSLTLAADPVWDKGQIADKTFRSKAGATFELADAGDFDVKQSFSYGAWVKIRNANASGAFFSRMDDKSDFRGWDLWFEAGRFGTHIVSKWPDDALKVVTEARLQPNSWHHVFVAYDGSAKAAGVKLYIDGILQDRRSVFTDKLKSTTRTKVPFKLAQRNTTSPLNDVAIQDVRVYGRALTPVDVERLARGTRAAYLAARPADKRTPAETNELFDWWLPAMDKGYQDVAAKLASLRREEAAIRASGAVTHVMSEREAKPIAHILFRGEYDKRRDEVSATTPAFLPPMPDDLPRNRLGLAKWLMRPENPLTARVTVNRFWQEVFGTGLVRTSGDFGIAGELPSHPELLDCMAVEFRESGWDVKKFFKRIVTSATYRQAATATAAKREKDPHNRLLSYGPRYRMDAEMIRDYALSSSGLLVRKIGGPSVRPYQPDGVWEAVAMIGSNTRDYKRDNGDSLYRRSMYTFWKRAAPPASMEIFNAPSREVCTVRRERTDTPLQALVTLNDPQFVEAARHLAQVALKDGGDTDDKRIDFIARRLLARSFSAEELKVVKGGLADLLTHYKEHPIEARKLLTVGESKADANVEPAALAAWTMLVNELMNLDEVLNK
jgi:hypothetical protein